MSDGNMVTLYCCRSSVLLRAYIEVCWRSRLHVGVLPLPLPLLLACALLSHEHTRCLHMGYQVLQHCCSASKGSLTSVCLCLLACCIVNTVKGMLVRKARLLLTAKGCSACVISNDSACEGHQGFANKILLSESLVSTHGPVQAHAGTLSSLAAVVSQRSCFTKCEDLKLQRRH